MKNQRNMSISGESITCERPQKKQRCVEGGCNLLLADNILCLLNDIGVANYKHGEYHEAVECFSQVLRIIDSNELPRDLSNGFHKKQEQQGESQTGRGTKIEYDEGMRVYRDLLQAQEEEEDGVAVLLYNLGQAYIQSGLFKQAKICLFGSLDKFSAMSGTRNYPLYVVMNLHSLGYCLYRTGKDEKASVFYQRALALVSEGSMGQTHLAASMNCAAVLLFNKPQSCDTEIDTAMKMFRKSLDLYQSCSNGTNNIDSSIATVLNNIGRVHFMQSEFKEARKVYEECLSLRREILGSQSIDVAATSYNLGQTCCQLGSLDEALSYYKDCLKIIGSSSALKNNAPSSSSKDVALIYKGIGEIYQDKSDNKMALYYYQKALEAQKEYSNGNPNSDIAATLNKLGSLCYEMKDFYTALVHYEEGLKMEQSLLTTDHPHIIVTMINIGHIQKQMGQYSKALSAYQHVYQIQRKTFDDGGNNNNSNLLDIAETLSSIGLMQYHLKQYEESFGSYQEALSIRRHHLGSDEHPEIASTMNAIGLVLFKQELFEPAKDCFQESLRIRSKLLGKDHRDVAILWYNIATIHFETGEDDLAVQMYKETLRLERHNLGGDHPDVVLTLKHLGQVHLQMGRTEEAIDYFQEALTIERSSKESSVQQRPIARILNLLGNAYLQLGRTRDMMECFIEAGRIYESSSIRRGSNDETLVIGGYSFYGLNKTNPPSAAAA